MPPNTINVARSSRWGNPFAIGKAGPVGAIATDQGSQSSCLRRCCSFTTSAMLQDIHLILNP